LLCATVDNAISVLPEQAREEILRYYFLHQSQRVIGTCIDRSRSTAGRHIQIALWKLREECE
jgi:DNA-directed RNA polymerase specialized sigma24 family protein